MKSNNPVKKILWMVLPCILLASCTPVETLVQTAIAQTQTAAPTATSTGLSVEAQVQTAVAQTITPVVAAFSTASSSQLQAAVAQTLTAIIPPATPTPEFSPTPETPVPTITNTHAPYPTITNTVEPYVPSGPITITKIEDAGENQVQIAWDATGNFPNGFYVLWSRNAEPTFPDDYNWYFGNGHARSVVVDLKQAKTYYYRICEPDPERKHCINYSNTVQYTNH